MHLEIVVGFNWLFFLIRKQAYYETNKKMGKKVILDRIPITGGMIDISAQRRYMSK